MVNDELNIILHRPNVVTTHNNATALDNQLIEIIRRFDHNNIIRYIINYYYTRTSTTHGCSTRGWLHCNRAGHDDGPFAPLCTAIDALSKLLVSRSVRNKRVVAFHVARARSGTGHFIVSFSRVLVYFTRSGVFAPHCPRLPVSLSLSLPASPFARDCSTDRSRRSGRYL